MSFVASPAARKRPVDDIAPSLSTDAPALVLSTKIPAYRGAHRKQHASQQQQQHVHVQQASVYPRRVYGSPPHEAHQLHHLRQHPKPPQLSPVTPSASTPAHGDPPARMRDSSFSVLDAQNKSPRKAPAKRRRLGVGIGIGLDDDHELKTPVVRPSVNPLHDVLVAERHSSDHWGSDHAMPYSPLYVDSGAIENEVVRRLVAPPGLLPHLSSPQQPLQLQSHPPQPQPQAPHQLLQAATTEQNENRTPAAAATATRVAKPVAMRAFAPAALESTPPVTHISKYFAAKSSSATAADAQLHATSPFAPSATAVPRRPQHLGFSRKLPLESPGLTPSNAPRSGSGSNSSNAVPSSFVLESDLCLGGDDDSDDDSIDDELAQINNAISLSQEKLLDLSVDDVSTPSDVPALVLSLNPQFARTLSSDEKSRMKELGVYVISLTAASSPIQLGRDPFNEVFGESIHGVDVFALSRRHCVLYVTATACGQAVSVVVQNTSMNGLEVNNRPMKNNERRELRLGDTVTLLPFHSRGSRRMQNDMSLSYNLRCIKRRQLFDSRLLVRPSIKPRETSSSDSDESDGDNDRDEQLQQVAQQEPAAVESAPVPKSALASLPAKHQQTASQTLDASSVALAVSKPSAAESNDLAPCMEALSAPAPTRLLHVQIAEPLSTIGTSAHHRGYREELASILASISSVDGVDIDYDSATAESFKSVLRDSASIVLYAGGGDASYVVTEDTNGLPVPLSSAELSAFVQTDPHATSKLLVVFAPTLTVASMFHVCGLSSVVFVSSLDAHRTRAAAFLRALFAGVLRGYSIRTCYDLAELVARSDAHTLLGERNDLCALLTTRTTHTSSSDSDDDDSTTSLLLLPESSADGAKCRAWQFTPSLSASFIPLAPATFVGRESEIADIISCLRTTKVQVCTITGRPGVGKSAVAAFVAKHAHDRRWYGNGVHYYAVERRHRRSLQRTRGSGSAWTDTESERVRDLALAALVDDLSALLVALPSAANDDDKTALVVLDGCDDIVPSAFRDSVVDLIARFPAAQFVVTARQDMQVALYTPSAVLEHVVAVQGLGDTDAARLLLALAKTHLRPNEFARALPDPTVATLATHEALTRLRGYPLLLTRLTLELRRRSLDALK